MREINKVLGSRIMIKKLDNKTKIGDLVIEDDGETLPIAEVVMVASDIDQVQVGDIIHYTMSRESGRCRHKGEEHFIISIANAIAITDE